jgi:hypothetical protein
MVMGVAPLVCQAAEKSHVKAYFINVACATRAAVLQTIVGLLCRAMVRSGAKGIG